jgi:hypothetical protein
VDIEVAALMGRYLEKQYTADGIRDELARAAAATA